MPPNPYGGTSLTTGAACVDYHLAGQGSYSVGVPANLVDNDSNTVTGFGAFVYTGTTVDRGFTVTLGAAATFQKITLDMHSDRLSSDWHIFVDGVEIAGTWAAVSDGWDAFGAPTRGWQTFTASAPVTGTSIRIMERVNSGGFNGGFELSEMLIRASVPVDPCTHQWHGVINHVGDKYATSSGPGGITPGGPSADGTTSRTGNTVIDILHLGVTYHFTFDVVFTGAHTDPLPGSGQLGLEDASGNWVLPHLSSLSGTHFEFDYTPAAGDQTNLYVLVFFNDGTHANVPMRTTWSIDGPGFPDCGEPPVLEPPETPIPEFPYVRGTSMISPA